MWFLHGFQRDFSILLSRNIHPSNPPLLSCVRRLELCSWCRRFWPPEKRHEEKTWLYREEQHRIKQRWPLRSKACVTSEPVGISLCCGAIEIQTVLGDGACLAVLHHQSYQKNEDDAVQNDEHLSCLFLLDSPLSPRVSHRFPFGSPSILFLVDGQLSALLFPSNSHEHLKGGGSRGGVRRHVCYREHREFHI